MQYFLCFKMCNNLPEIDLSVRKHQHSCLTVGRTPRQDMRWLTAYIIGTKKGKTVPEKSALLARVTLDSTVTKSQNQHGPMAYPQYVFKPLHVPSAGRGIPSFTKRCLNASYPLCGKGHTPLQTVSMKRGGLWQDNLWAK